MAWEIERRFLVRVADATWLGLGEGYHLRQGYVQNGEPSIRVRIGESRGATLTCKSGSGIRRSEVEAVIPGDVAQALFQAAEYRVIEKIRWRVGDWELDRFLGPLEGLMLMEIELEEEDQAMPPVPEGVHILHEVTEDNRFMSGHLAGMEPKKQQTLVKKAYKELKGWKVLSV
jgi:CYTH domain-containing protein